MATSFSSPVIMGILADVEIYKIKESNYSYDNNELTSFDELIGSIKEKGLLQPILVRPRDNFYQIVAGNRRYQACRSIGWKRIVCHVLEIDDREAFEISLIENIQRKSMSPIGEANAFKDYILKFGWGGISDLAKRIGKSISYVDKKLRLLSLPSDVTDLLSKGGISPSIAEELLPIRNANEQSRIAGWAKTRQLSSRAVRNIVKERMENPVYNFDLPTESQCNTIAEIDSRTHRSFDKAIIAIRMAMNRLSSIIEENEDNWILFETLMQHKAVLHSQIDLLIKEKRNYDIHDEYLVSYITD
jgi:ParB family transcriptional regulator, chromosome partitioning protein